MLRFFLYSILQTCDITTNLIRLALKNISRVSIKLSSNMDAELFFRISNTDHSECSWIRKRETSVGSRCLE